jgi:hypothetical protein
VIWKRLVSTSVFFVERRAFTDDHQTDIRGLPIGKGLRGYRIRICSSGAASV